MKKGRFLWSAHRITEKQKAGKARNIKEKQLKNSRRMVLLMIITPFKMAEMRMEPDQVNIALGIKVDSPGIKINSSVMTIITAR